MPCRPNALASSTKRTTSAGSNLLVLFAWNKSEFGRWKRKMSQRNSISIIYRRASLKPWMYVTSQAQGQPRLLFFQHVSTSIQIDKMMIGLLFLLKEGHGFAEFRSTPKQNRPLTAKKVSINDIKACLIQTGAKCRVYRGPPKAELNTCDVFMFSMMSFSIHLSSIHPIILLVIYWLFMFSWSALIAAQQTWRHGEG